ncbi:MAG: OmpA family protein [Pseudomonadota bacterium]
MLVGWLLLWPAISAASVSYETITFISSDGHSYVNYATTRSENSSYNVFMPKGSQLSEYLYINPHDFEFDTTSSENDVLRFSQGSYALMSEGDYSDPDDPHEARVEVDEEGNMALVTWNGIKQSDGHFGYWNVPDNFAHFASAWVFPEEYEIIDYFANRPGQWVERGHTLAFFAADSNDLTFEIHYRPRTQEAFVDLKTQLQMVPSADVEQTADTVKVILANEILFASGSASLSDAGENLIRDLASGFVGQQDIEVIVAGHTDNVPIRGALKEIYPTNWELSAKRALNVVHALSSAGVPPTRLQAQAYGPFRPRVANDSALNRGVNRRIEITIKPL